MLNAECRTVGQRVTVRGRPIPRESLRTVALAALDLIEAQLVSQAEAGVDLDAAAAKVARRLRVALG